MHSTWPGKKNTVPFCAPCALAQHSTPPPPPPLVPPYRCRIDEPIVNGWLFVRYLVVGLYVGLATVAGFLWWFLGYAQGGGLTWPQLTSFQMWVEVAVVVWWWWWRACFAPRILRAALRLHLGRAGARDRQGGVAWRDGGANANASQAFARTPHRPATVPPSSITLCAASHPSAPSPALSLSLPPPPAPRSAPPPGPRRCREASAAAAGYSCKVFESPHPRTISMTVLVVVEMFNALNNLSEDASLLVGAGLGWGWAVGVAGDGGQRQRKQARGVVQGVV